MAADNIVTRQTYRNLLKTTMEATSIRNALGDIGNRIGLGNVQLAANKNDPNQPLKSSLVSTLSSTTVVSENVKQHAVGLKTVSTVVELVSSNSSGSSSTTSTTTSNTSCVMLEVTSDEEDTSNEAELLDDDQVEANGGGGGVVDIDAEDADNPQLFSEYVRDIYSYLGHLERKYRISPHFLHAKMITSKMRAVLIDWLMQVHAKFRLLQETMYLCVYLIDAYLERQDVSKTQLQLVGVTALFLACKYEEMYVPAVEDFVYMTDHTYTAGEIRAMEISMCKTLEFAFGKPLPLHFLRRFSKAGQADPKHHTLAKYFMELSLHDAEFASIDPSYLAAASLCLSFKLLNGPQWDKNMEHHSNYKRSSLLSGMQKLAKLVVKTNEPDYKYRAAYIKHTSSKCMRISMIPELSGLVIKELAAQS